MTNFNDNNDDITLPTIYWVVQIYTRHAIFMVDGAGLRYVGGTQSQHTKTHTTNSNLINFTINKHANINLTHIRVIYFERLYI